ncbi:MAG: hypothetical protein JNL28_11120 [Planctomycetes bacterium]|nr:hypothetical protein [Planctomycetota bacterium]
MNQFAWMLSASVLASVAVASPSAATQPNTFLLSGEILVYTPADTGLPLSTLVAPRGARTDRPQLLTVRGISSANADGAELSSSPLVHGRGELVMGEQSDSPLAIGELSLRNDADGWVFYATTGDLAGRPVFRFADEATALKTFDNGDIALSGEFLLHEAMADELGLRGARRPQSLVAGAFTLIGARAQGQGVSITPPAQQQPVVASSALSVAGPDVIVSTIGSTFTKNGTVGTITGYSVTTVSCNIGTTDAIWIDCTTGGPTCNQHPVIGTQFYRFKTVAGATRFEQIGLSWLKHGFCAADASNCGQTPTPNGSCDWLGLWSTDTYSASLNGQQSNLGPRSEIQAWSGVYPYPYVLNWQSTGNAIYKRTQVENADMDPALNAGASYLAEVVYICTDEPDANKYNNYSNRPFTVGAISGGGFPGTFTGTTNREQAAIERWPLMDTGVTLVTVDVPGDGRFLVGGKATDIGGGLWHYEYAVFNMNSHDSARLVQVPADNTVTVTNVDFHDVNYHSGEPYDGTDWPSVKTSTNVEWSTSTFAANANANALRWSTTYNFRFDADAPPISGNVNIGLFRSGGSATAVGLPVPGSGLPINTPYCFGDGTGVICPCGNNGVVGGGCANSLLTSAIIGVSGTASISADSLALNGSGMPNGPALYFQGTAQNPGLAFGDGLLCVSGTITRLGILFNAGGASSYPGVTDPSVSVKGLVAAPGVRTYQIWYRDGDPTFCNPTTYNLSNGYQVVWTP